MLAPPAELSQAFDGLPIAREPMFAKLLAGGRLRYAAASDGSSDIVDDYSSRLVCECINSRSPLLMVWPDTAERRAPLALAAGVVCDSLFQMARNAGRGRILYVGPDASVREQFASVSVGHVNLSGVFAQEFGRGDCQLRRVGPESSLPVVTTIVSPADPEQIIRSLQPRWIAVDCGRREPPPWLPALLAAARTLRVPVIGWSFLHLSPVIDLWRAQGGGVFHWPKVIGPSFRIASLDEISQRTGTTELTPMILDGENATEIADHLTQCYSHLVRHIDRHHGRVARDALSIAWRYLRLLESLPVPIDLYDAECVNYWRMPTLGSLKAMLERFIQAIQGDRPLRTDLGGAYERLATAHEGLRNQSDPPLWLATANLAVEATGQSQYIFPSCAYRDLFKFALLSRFNVSEDDLRELGVSALALSEVSQNSAGGGQVTLVGLPSRMLDWRIEAALVHQKLRVVVWPHLEDSLRRRAADWSARLSGGCDGTTPLKIAKDSSRAQSAWVHVANTRGVNLGNLRIPNVPASNSGLALWKRPDGLEAIRKLFAVQDVEAESGDERAPAGSGIETVGSGADDWIEDVLQVAFSDGGQILLPLDDFVNVIARTSDGVKIESRYSKSLRAGDEILLVHGEHRRSVYDLLVSRVHTHPTIAPWLNLVDRWHQDLRRAFVIAKRKSGATFESVLNELNKHGSKITTSVSVRGWIVGVTLAPSDWEDIRRLGDILDITIAKQFAQQISKAANQLAGLHRSLSNRLNRWLASEDATDAALSGAHTVVDADLGLTMDDFKHSLVRGRVASVAQIHGPFLRSHIGFLRRTAT